MVHCLHSLTDPLIWDNETIFMDVSVRGTYPGNMFDMTPFVKLSDDSDNFTSADVYQYRRSIKVSISGGSHARASALSAAQACPFRSLCMAYSKHSRQLWHEVSTLAVQHGVAQSCTVMALQC